MSFKIIRKNCCELDIHKTWIFACIDIADTNNRVEYKQAHFSSFTKGLNELCDWLAKYNCTDICMESTGNTGFRFSISYRLTTYGLLYLTLNIPSLKKVTKPTARMQSGFATCICAVW